MLKKFNDVMTAIGFVVLIAMFVATYAVTSGKVTAMLAKPATATASTQATPAS